MRRSSNLSTDFPGNAVRSAPVSFVPQTATLDVATNRSYTCHVFTWDDKKRKLNLAKHGIDLADAPAIFDGPLVTVEDTRERYGEPRYVALGILGDVVVSMVYSERNEQIRIISIRKALKHEARFFFSQIGK